MAAPAPVDRTHLLSEAPAGGAGQAGELGGHEVAALAPDVAAAAAAEKPDAPKESGLSNKRLHGGWVATAIAIVALLAGAAGALAYMGHLNVTLVGVGTLSQTVGLYTALGGLGVFALATAAIACNYCNHESAKTGDTPRVANTDGDREAASTSGAEGAEGAPATGGGAAAAAAEAAAADQGAASGSDSE